MTAQWTRGDRAIGRGSRQTVHNVANLAGKIMLQFEPHGLWWPASMFRRVALVKESK